MKLFDLLGYLVGKRSSIERVAHSRWALLVGGLFVLSAGFAREYDGEDLLHEPWHLLLPLAASLGTSTVLYGILYVAVLRHAFERVQPLAMYGCFLSLYWMTAPLAWLYAIPVEQFTTPGMATRINLSLLGIVALWRVLLISRAAAVLFGASFWSMFALVMLFGDVLALVILWFTPLPVFNIMGGIRLTESEVVIQDTAFTIGALGVLSLPIWLIGISFVMAGEKRNWKRASVDAQPVSLSVWALAILSVVVWSVVLPFTQPAQQLAWKVESDLEDGRIENAIKLMSKNERESFPAHWDPPPWPGYNHDDPPLLDVIEVIEQTNPNSWVRVMYIDKLLRKLNGYGFGTRSLRDLEEQDLIRFLKLLKRTPETHASIRRNPYEYEQLTAANSSASEEVKQLARDLLKTAKVEPEEE